MHRCIGGALHDTATATENKCNHQAARRRLSGFTKAARTHAHKRLRPLKFKCRTPSNFGTGSAKTGRRHLGTSHKFHVDEDRRCPNQNMIALPPRRPVKERRRRQRVINMLGDIDERIDIDCRRRRPRPRALFSAAGDESRLLFPQVAIFLHYARSLGSRHRSIDRERKIGADSAAPSIFLSGLAPIPIVQRVPAFYAT